jgi:hypothetical protein
MKSRAAFKWGDLSLPLKLTGIDFPAVPFTIGGGTADILNCKVLVFMDFLLFPSGHIFRLKIWAFLGPILNLTSPLSRH